MSETKTLPQPEQKADNLELVASYLHDFEQSVAAMAAEHKPTDESYPRSYSSIFKGSDGNMYEAWVFEDIAPQVNQILRDITLERLLPASSDEVVKMFVDLQNTQLVRTSVSFGKDHNPKISNRYELIDEPAQIEPILDIFSGSQKLSVEQQAAAQTAHEAALSFITNMNAVHHSDTPDPAANLDKKA